MLKKVIFLLLSTSLCAADADNKLSTTQKVFIGSAIGAGALALAIVAGPVILPASAIVAIKGAAATVAVKATAAAVTIKSSVVTAAPVAGLISKGISGVYLAKGVKEYVYPTTEQKINQLLREEASEKPFEEQLKEVFGKK